MSHTRLLMTCLALCLCVGACREDTAPVEPQADAGTPQADPAKAQDSCPVHVPATTVTVVNTKGGVVMFFTTTQSNVEELRRRVETIAKVDTSKVAEPVDPEADPRVAPPPWVFGAQPELVPLQAKAESVSDGAALVLTPLNPMDIEEIRSYARSYADRMRLGRCPNDFMKVPQRSGPLNAIAPPNGSLG